MRQSRKSNRIAQMEKTASFYAYISNECVDTVALLGCRILGRKQCVQANNDPGGCLLRVRRIKDDQNLSVIWRG